ncbi:MAG: hemolysin secretion protein D [Rhodanobacteraceae bacterium]|nr:hemolysin secretion protein D [Rhodanobacteraceae bacterium]
MRPTALWLLLPLLLAACQHDQTTIALGTLEWDRVELVSVAAEPITAISVHEGEQVIAGALILEQRGDRAEAELAVAAADLDRVREQLAEQRAGARPEQKREVAARSDRARAALKLAEDELQRGLSLKARGLISAAELDRLSATAELARSELAAARASQDLVLAGTRTETLAQTRAAVAAAEHRLAGLQITRGRLRHVAPVAARIETLPLEIGDTPVVGATIATLLIGAQPYARVYLSPAQRAATKIGSRFSVAITGHDGALMARVRMLAAQSSFTPYYALTGNDANRLAFLAELEFDAGAASELAAGLPLQATPKP